MRQQLFKLTIAALFATASALGLPANGQALHGRDAASLPRAIVSSNPPWVAVTQVTLVEQDAKHSTFDVRWELSAADLKPETVDIIAILIGLKSRKEARISLTVNANGELPASARLTISHVDGLLPYLEQDNVRVAVTVSVRGRAGGAKREVKSTKESVFKVNRPS